MKSDEEAKMMDEEVWTPGQSGVEALLFMGL